MRLWFRTTKRTTNGGLRWVSIWLGFGVLIGLLLLTNSVRDYLFVARLLTIQQVRQQIGQHVATFERDLTDSALSDEQLLKTLSEELNTGSLKPIWIVMRGPDGREIGRMGNQTLQAFTRDEENSLFLNRTLLFKVIPDSSGETVVEVFPVRIRPRKPQMEQERDLDRRRPPVSAEIAVPLTLTDSSLLWPIRRNLIINCAAAFALLATVALTAVGLRSYIRGKQLEQQLELAREVQANLLPGEVNLLGGTQVAAEYHPAEEVAGDFYDVFETSKGTALVIGDVSGKGVPAALLVGVIHGAVRSGKWSESRASHQQETAALNHLLCERASQNLFATMFWSYGDAQTGTVNYVNAGHCPPILASIRNGKPELKRLDVGGTVLGLLPEANYVQGQIAVAPNDLIVLYSDGLVEATSSAGEEFGEWRLTTLLLECIEDTPAKIQATILRAVRDFLGPNSAQDDLTCVVARFGTAVAKRQEVEVASEVAPSLIVD